MSLVLLGLAGCAGAHVTNVAEENTGSSTPTEILVQIDTSQAAQSASSETLNKVATSLQSDLIEKLTKAGVTAEPFIAGTDHPGAAVLRVSVTNANPGNLAERFIIGFGLGSAKLQATAVLENAATAEAQPLVSFDTSSNSGVKPGLILPGGIALATGSVVHLAIGGGIDVVANVNGGLSKPLEKTASAVVGQLKTYYAAVGWTWPADV